MDFTPIIRELNERSAFRERLGNPGTLEDVGTNPKYPRLVGQRLDGTRVVVLIKVTPTKHASGYRHWLTLSPAELASIGAPPIGYHYFVAQVGELPDGGPWWIALYDTMALAKAAVDVDLRLFQEMPADRGGRFYRVNPKMLPQYALPTLLDMQTMSLGLDEPDPGPPLPDQIIIGKNGAYWRKFGENEYSMAIVSTDNDPIEPVAVYERVS